MLLLGLDLGGTKLAIALMADDGTVVNKKSVPVKSLGGYDVGRLINDQIAGMMKYAESQGNKVSSIGISVPGISHSGSGTVWAPNIKGWEDFPLLAEVSRITGNIPVSIDSDRACYILGESWNGNACGCRNAIFLGIGTGIGAGIMINGEILRGSHDIAGAIGWMALDRPFSPDYTGCGCFEYHGSGEGIGRIARTYLNNNNNYEGDLRKKPAGEITSHDVFEAYEKGDPLANLVIGECVEFWGMAAANLVSLFNPEKIIFGGGVFGPAIPLIPAIQNEASKWAQPVSIKQVIFEPSALEGDAGVTGACYLALKKLKQAAL